MRAALLGASGYAGSELLRLMVTHPELELVLASADSAVGVPIGSHVPSLAAAYPVRVYDEHERVFSTDAEIVFCALPHGVSQRFVARLRRDGRLVVDLGADFRLRDPALYSAWYHQEHTSASLLSEAVYGLVERHRVELRGAQLLAIPGCYPTASALALGPFADAGWLHPTGSVVNALSGTSGAGRASSDRLHFSRLHANAEAYGLLTHRHTVEIEQEIGLQVIFTPHLVPVSRGMIVTAYGAMRAPRSTKEAMALLHERYDTEPFVVVVDEPPSMKDPLGSNLCFVSARVDERTGWLVAMSAIDNLTKGAAGQAIQALNVAVGWPEAWGLSNAGVSP